MQTVFLSASVPLLQRDERYFRTADVIAIRDSVRALVSVLGTDGTIVSGGHPAITPMIVTQMEQMGTDPRERVVLYQSEYFGAQFPEDKVFFPNVIHTPRRETREQSLETLRTTMLLNHTYDAAIFIGGMEGVEAEFEFWRLLNPQIPCFPIGSTGAAAEILLKQSVDRGERFRALGSGEDVTTQLFAQVRYLALFRTILGAVSANVLDGNRI